MLFFELRLGLINIFNFNYEPEISLHISWQKNFISDLKDIQKLNSLEIIIANDSPDIISNNWNLTIKLAGP